jgi:hypothetical protein
LTTTKIKCKRNTRLETRIEKKTEDARVRFGPHFMQMSKSFLALNFCIASGSRFLSPFRLYVFLSLLSSFYFATTRRRLQSLVSRAASLYLFLFIHPCLWPTKRSHCNLSLKYSENRIVCIMQMLKCAVKEKNKHCLCN